MSADEHGHREDPYQAQAIQAALEGNFFLLTGGEDKVAEGIVRPRSSIQSNSRSPLNEFAASRGKLRALPDDDNDIGGTSFGDLVSSRPKKRTPSDADYVPPTSSSDFLVLKADGGEPDNEQTSDQSDCDCSILRLTIAIADWTS